MMKKICILFLLAAILALPPVSAKRPDYQITLKIKGGKDTVMFMGHYQGKGNVVVDTAKIDKKGRFVFEQRDRVLEPGLYFFANNKGNYVEFVVYKEKPFFTFETEERDWTSCMQVKGSAQNSFFFDFHRQDNRVNEELDRQSLLLDSVAFDAYRRTALMRLDSIKREMIARDPRMFLSKMMTCTREVEVPMVDAQGDSLTEPQLRYYYMTHYFDNMSFEDDALLRTPRAVFADRVMRYFDRYLKYAEPDTICFYTDLFLNRAKQVPKIYQWALITLTQKYLQSNVMVHDAVYVHLVKKYYAAEDNTWSSPSSIESELTRANKWERLLVGKEAPELILYDTLRVPHSLHALPNRWKLLVFWSPSCGHCKHIIPAIYDVFTRKHATYDLGVYAILSEPDDKTRQEWKQFLKEHEMDSPTWVNLDGGEANIDWHDVYDVTSTPQLYLLDEHNIIRAKKFTDSNFEAILEALCK